jgi:hypothetical protein
MFGGLGLVGKDGRRVLVLSWRFRLLVEAATRPWKALYTGIGSQILLW